MNEKRHKQILVWLLIATIVTMGILTGCIEDEEGIQTVPVGKMENTSKPTPTYMQTQTPTPTPTPMLTPTPIPLKNYEELPYNKANSEPITLINHRDATKPTFRELRKFIEEDKTNDFTYSEYSYVCGDYAERVHNNAEAQGIKAGVVIVSFKNDVDLHALNIFDTKDYGKVYVDCTGRGVFIPEWGTEYFCDPYLVECNTDGFAYIKENREYGVISMDVVSFNTKYEYYEVFKNNREDFYRDIGSYNKEMREYNIAMGKYNREVDYYNSLPDVFYDEEMYKASLELYRELGDRERELDGWGIRLGIKLRSIENREGTYCCVCESLGIVEDVEIYW